MSEAILITDSELEQARRDPACRHRLTGKYLELLTGELKSLRALSAGNPRQIREGIELADKLTDLLQQLSVARTRVASLPAGKPRLKLISSTPAP
jgi:hypothetical protein